MSAFGAFAESITVSTLYTNLGDEAVIHGLNETGVNLVVTSHELLPKFRKMLDHCPAVKTIVVMEDQLFPTDTTGYKEGVKIIPFNDAVKLGGNSKTDMSTKVMRGQKGDASVLKPTMMCVVPLILDRIYKNIIDSVDKRGANFQKVFEFCYRYKLYWRRSGQPTPIVDKIVFNKIKKLLGGKMRFAITGGAPLSPETHDFIRVCLGLTLVQVR